MNDSPDSVDTDDIVSEYLRCAAIRVATKCDPDSQVDDIVLAGKGVNDIQWFDVLLKACEGLVKLFDGEVLEGELYLLGDMGFDELFYRCPASVDWLKAQFDTNASLAVMREVMISWKLIDEFPIDNWL